MNKIKDKIKIVGNIEILTGLHITGKDDFTIIGEANSITIKDPLTKRPLIPGSSLKGKLRYLLARETLNSNEIYMKRIEEEPIEIKRMFGASGETIIPSRFIFRDSFYDEELSRKSIDEELIDVEIKAENTINRIKVKATSRFIERVPVGNYFKLEIVYNVENITDKEIEEDFNNLIKAFKLLQWDYLGGNGTRGYGKVKIKNLKLESLNSKNYDNIKSLLNSIEV